MEAIELQKLYRQPWSKNDNPNAWVEITTDCNMACPGCYRGCDRPDNIARHFPVDEIKFTILEMKKIRNCKSVSISGGEPLLHPELGDIVSFIRQHNMDPIIFTNGELLSESLLHDLKSRGLAGLVIRVDSLRIHGRKNEEELNRLRQYYADLVNRVGGLTLAYTCVIDRNNLDGVPSVIRWAQVNHEKVNVMVLILKRKIVFNLEEPFLQEDAIKLTDLLETLIRELPGIKFSSFLGSEKEPDQIKWLQAYWMAKYGRVLGYTPPKFIEIGQNYHHYKHGTYTYIMKRDAYRISFSLILLLSFILKEFRKTILPAYLKTGLRHLFTFTGPASLQLINIVCPPEFVNGERDLCDSCPDAVLYQGRLEPSCMLEEIIRFGHLISVKDKASIPAEVPGK